MLVLLRRTVLFAACLALTVWFYNGYVSAEAPFWSIFIGHVLTAFTALAFVLFIDTLLRYFFWDGYLKKILGIAVPQLLPHTVSLVLYVTTFVNVLRYDYGVSLAGALAASGFVAIILGFALRSVILDLFTGLAISADKSYVVGDWITVSSRDFPHPMYGQVEDVDWRTTRLRMEDGTLLIMPNSMGGAFAITNHSQPRGPKRLEFTFLLPHETPHARAFGLIEGAAHKVMQHDGYYIDPAPEILINAITRDGVDYLVRFYADIHHHSPSRATSRVYEAVHAAVLQNNLSFPGEKVEVQNRRKAHSGAKHLEIDPLTALKRTPLFSQSLTSEELESLAEQAVRQKFEPDDHLITEGDEGDSLYILLSGAAGVYYHNGDSASSRLATLSTGDIVGEMALLTGKPRSASVIADTYVDALEVSKAQFSTLMSARPEIAETLSELLAARSAEQAVADQSTQNLDELQETAKAGFLKGIRSFFGL